MVFCKFLLLFRYMSLDQQIVETRHGFIDLSQKQNKNKK